MKIKLLVSSENQNTSLEGKQQIKIAEGIWILITTSVQKVKHTKKNILIFTISYSRQSKYTNGNTT